ncbi:UPF0481 protein At3g47200-like [Amaranthus tricolor]|uniref:UPF0481 protein At3g47200-like n=1 Tax=Amaranthus tricolor TaxID=29722 RepID=UPI0025856B99|nr:UPF0481 protein At3g47200-like [Amaranthus tricolor]
MEGEANKTKEVESSIQHKLSALPMISPCNICIYKVPPHICQVNKACFLPSIVSIGPIYFKYPSLKSCEDFKLTHLKHFLELHALTSSHRHHQAYNLANYIDIMKHHEENARSYYEHQISLSSNEFIEMMMVDAAFIICYFICNSDCGIEFSNRNNPMHQKITWMVKITHDLFLEENQIPFFVLEDLYNLSFGAAYPHISFKDLTLRFIQNSEILEGYPRDNLHGSFAYNARKASNIKHLVDFLRVSYLPSNLRTHQYIINKEEVRFCPSAKELKAAGIKFICSSEKNSLLDIRYCKGKLRIPTLKIQDETEAFIRNLVFFEQCQHFSNSYFIDYAIFLNDLIGSAEDVQILVQNGIIENFLGSHEEVALMLNRITKNIMLLRPNFYYSGICGDMNKYVSIKWNRWKAILRRDYFNHPWSIISVVYLVFLLILTILQVFTGFHHN